MCHLLLGLSQEDISTLCYQEVLKKCVFSSLSRGPGGVGITELKRRLVISDPDHYGVSVPCKANICRFPNLKTKTRFIF